MVSYRIMGDDTAYYGLTQSSNFGSGGLLLPTTRAFSPGMRLKMNIRIPSTPLTLSLAGKVVASKEIVRRLVYNTRVCFCELDVAASEQLAQLVAEFGAQPLPSGGGV